MPVLEKNSGHTCRWLGCSISINSSSLQMTALDRSVQSLSKHSGEAAMPLRCLLSCFLSPGIHIYFPVRTKAPPSELKLENLLPSHLNHICAILRNETLLHAFKEVNQLQIVPGGLKKLENAPTNGSKVKIQSVVFGGVVCYCRTILAWVARYCVEIKHRFWFPCSPHCEHECGDRHLGSCS